MSIQRTNVLRLLPSHTLDVPRSVIFNGSISHGAFRLHLVMRSISTKADGVTPWEPTKGGYATIMRRHGMKASPATVDRWCFELKRRGLLEITGFHNAEGKKVYTWAVYPEPKEIWLQDERTFIKGLSLEKGPSKPSARVRARA